MTPLPTRTRFTVDLSTDPGELDRQLEHLLLFLPSGAVTRLAPFGFSFRREPDAFAVIAIGTTLGMSILTAEFSLNVPYFSHVGVTLSALFFLTSLALCWRVVRNRLHRLEFAADGTALLLREMLGQRLVRSQRFEAEQIVEVLVLVKEGEEPQVVLGGPRHTILGEIFRPRTLDPERLAPWMAEMVALVARRASVVAPQG